MKLGIPLADHQQWFCNELAEFIYYRTYSRFRYDLGRREHWPETVQRTVDYLRELGGEVLSDEEYAEIGDAILSQSALPSMRLFTMAGEAARRQPLCTFNCSALAIDSIDAFGEVLYLLSQGAGVGFGIERRVVDKLPTAWIADDAAEHPGLVVVEDSSEGWAEAFKDVIRLAYAGRRAEIDTSKVRAAGTPLRTKGGRSSGPAPLRELMRFTQDIIINAAKDGRKLSTLEVHDICTKIGTVIVVGGVRRSAMISMSDLGDDDLRLAKDGPFWEYAPWRAMANNSAVFEEPPAPEQFWIEWNALTTSGTGERGILNRHGIRQHRPARRKDSEFYVNPCGEAVLLDGGVCNLSEAVVREGDTLDDLKRKVRLASIIGTLQSIQSEFPYVRRKWSENASEERLLGVSLTGQLSNAELRSRPEWFAALKEVAVQTNAEYAQRLGIPQSVAVTLCKPSGTVSQLVSCSSGVHPWWSRWYIRRVRITTHDPLCKLLLAVGAPMVPEFGQTRENVTTWVVEFPVEAPLGSIFRHDMTAAEQLSYILSVQENYAEHGVSSTCYVGKDEWQSLGEMVLANFDRIAGVSFLPKDDAIYSLAPYEDIDEETYRRLKEAFPTIPYEMLPIFESEDNTEGAQTLACQGGACDI